MVRVRRMLEGAFEKLDELLKTLDRVASVVEFFSMDPTGEDGFVPPRYCWPPSIP